MNGYMIVTPSVTYALKGRDALRRAGFSARIERRNQPGSGGCGYGIAVNGNIRKIEQTLNNASVRIVEINDK